MGNSRPAIKPHESSPLGVVHDEMLPHESSAITVGAKRRFGARHKTVRSTENISKKLIASAALESPVDAACDEAASSASEASRRELPFALHGCTHGRFNTDCDTHCA